MANQSNRDQDKEIDLAQVTAKARGYITKVNDSFFDGILFIKRNIIVIICILILGAGLGYYMDKGPKSYSNKVIVHPNFESVDYLYQAVEDINLKIKQRDTMFLKSIGISEPKHFAKISIEPIVDIYNFMNESDNDEKEDSDRKLAVFKLIAENGDMKEALKDPTTSKNFDNHLIEIISRDRTKRSDIVDPVMAYFNSNPYFKSIQEEYINNVNIKLVANDSSIKQVDRVIDYLTDAGRKPGTSSVYYNETTDLANVLHFKNMILKEQAKLRLKKTDYTAIFKDRGILLNEKSGDVTSGSMKFILPMVLFALFVIIMMMRSYYRSQINKRKIIITENK